MVIKDNFTYIDLFAGIGGFHQAMQKYSKNSKCIMASEIDKHAAKVYFENYGIMPLGDIRNIEPNKIGKYDVVCGGFPCQTFSKAGKQKGFKDPRGTLFYEIVRLASYNKNIKDRPKILILENVHNLISHDGGDTWRTIKKEFKDIGYNVIESPIVIGPKDLGIPQLRDRAIILAVRKDIYNGPINIEIPRKLRNTTSIYSIVDKKLSQKELNEYKLSERRLKLLKCWDDFYHGIDQKILGTPIWSDEFGKKYKVDIKNEKGKYYIPKWKQKFILWNRELYKKNKDFIDKWYRKWDIKSWTHATERKFEWQCGEYCESVFDGIIQFRTSGIRVKRPTESPTLVTMSHIPVIGKKRRYLTVKEMARLQSFDEKFVFNEPKSFAYKQLGNAVNVDVIEFVFRKFIEFLEVETNGTEKNKRKN